MSNRVAVVTGASSGIGAATARALAESGFRVICAARRVERIEKLAGEIDGQAVHCDVTDPADVARLAEAVGERCDVLVNNAGGALGLEPVGQADFDKWQQMYATNVLGTGRVTAALLPAVEAARGSIVFITSTAADTDYEGAAGYCGAKAAERSIVNSLRLEIYDKPVRVIDISPGMVATEEFSLVRFGGDRAKSDKVYEGVAEPLTAEDIAECVRWTVELPAHVNIDRIVVRPRAQASQFKVFRES